jgi:hydrogenase expression/formation protein HypD
MQKMKYIDEYRDGDLMKNLTVKLQNFTHLQYTFMEVCGGHTMAIYRFGIKSLLPENIKLISGPGCPVCVTSKVFIDKALIYCKMKDVILTSFGDLIRVPGSVSSLEKEKANGCDIRVVFSSLEALEIARANPQKIIIFLAIGFETTAPGTAVIIKEAAKNEINNFFILNGHKIMPPALEALIHDGVRLDGFICPGHVSAITGSKIFEFIPEKYKLACVVTGFEPLDLIEAILMLCHQTEQRKPCVEIQYRRAVSREGNIIAQRHMKDVFSYSDEWWRGLGIIRKSGLKLRDEYSGLDIEKIRPVNITDTEEEKECICGEILKGYKRPFECKLFGSLCKPENPVGACMVSNEGACQAYYKYDRHG